MAEFVCGDDWDLEAVVRGYMSQASSAATCDIMEWFDPFMDDHDFTRSTACPIDFPAFCETTRLLDDLDMLYDPAMLPASSQATAVSTPGNSMEMVGKAQERSPAVASLADVEIVHAATKYKRRKNQHKQVVQHVTADGILSDPWAWRKYGQKPIKGSPFPRSYYRCSTSKGCLARKQVERSSSEPGMYVVTYTGEHSHTHPTRRSALAGITRSTKFSTSKKPIIVATNVEITTNHHGSSPSSTTTVEDGLCKVENLGWGESEIDEKVVELPSSLVLGEEIFMGFDEMDGLGMDFVLNGC